MVQLVDGARRPEVEHLVEHPVRAQPHRRVELLDEDRSAVAAYLGP